MTETASVKLLGSEVGAVTWYAGRGIGVFQYSAEFLESGIEFSPLMMNLSETIYEFPNLSSYAKPVTCVLNILQRNETVAN